MGHDHRSTNDDHSADDDHSTDDHHSADDDHPPKGGTAHAHHSTNDDHGSHADYVSGASTRTLAAVAGINLVGFVAELAGGVAFGSVALIGDAVHMLFDGLAYVMAFSASYTAERFAGGERWSYGLHRLEPVAAFLNGVLLLPTVGYILWESFRRVGDPVAVDPVPTLAVAVAGLAVNVVSVVVLAGGGSSLNERGAFAHLLGDAGGSVAVIVATVGVTAFDAPLLDPIAAVLIAVLVVASAGRVLAESTGILLQRSPVDTGRVRREIAACDGVARVDDLHVWRVCSRLTVGTVRVADTADSLADRRAVRDRVHRVLADHGVDHATVEITDDPPPTHDH